MNNRQRKILNSIFNDPVLSNIIWKDIESLLKASGARLTEGSGSRIGIELNGEDAVFHRPHPEKETDKGAVKAMRRFLINAGVRPC